MTHPSIRPESVAVVTGGASGIGLACATKFARIGMRVVIVDQALDKLEAAEQTLRDAGAAQVMTASTDVSDLGQVEALEKKVTDRLGGADILMNNAGVGVRSACTG
ncbi:MAG: SDR family NAD(P)-dependent oxidoreductase, partial [Pseudomonadota bacterium]